MIKTVEWRAGAVRLLDQRKLPFTEEYPEFTTYEQVASAIKRMVVRGAPAIGVAAAMGAALAAKDIETNDTGEFLRQFEEALAVLAATRPTAVNLFWAIERMRARAKSLNGRPVAEIRNALEEEAHKVYQEDLAINKTMGENGAALLAAGDSILTHCNAGALATAGGFGTALGVIKAAHLAGKKITVFADETRPWLQGARLTAWELMKEGIPVTLITDNMAGHCMKRGMISKIIVGADRIAANGDTANKIGTYTVAVMAKRHNLPFYVAAPMSTIDYSLPDGSHIPIEERASEEVTHIMGGQQIAPDGVKVFNPAFDVTPAELISGIITERGVAMPPNRQTLAVLRTA